MRVLVVMDPIETVNLKKDSTMAMLWAASRRGHTLGIVTGKQIGRAHV